MNYFTITAQQRIANGYLKWSENFDIHHKRAYYYHILGIFRWIFKPLNFNNKLKKLKEDWRDCSQIHPTKFYKKIEIVKRCW